MSTTKDVTVWCDAKGCDAWTYGGGTPASTVRGARNLTEAIGWEYRNGKDLCPEHKSER